MHRAEQELGHGEGWVLSRKLSPLEMEGITTQVKETNFSQAPRMNLVCILSNILLSGSPRLESEALITLPCFLRGIQGPEGCMSIPCWDRRIGAGCRLSRTIVRTAIGQEHRPEMYSGTDVASLAGL